uniref:Ig-like domain-containing protein n=1 Tax=Meleagris gallopavo TaxID=9103 RepID=A0A803YRM2_MELGA
MKPHQLSAAAFRYHSPTVQRRACETVLFSSHPASKPAQFRCAVGHTSVVSPKGPCCCPHRIWQGKAEWEQSVVPKVRGDSWLDVLGTACDIPCGTNHWSHVCCVWHPLGGHHALAALCRQRVTAESQGVSLGDTVTLRCHLPRPAARVDLYKEGYSGFEKQADMGMVHDVAEFLLVSVKMEDAVRYQCQYQVLEPPGTSKMSVPVELVVTGEDRRYPPPSISMGSGRNVRTGTNVTIRCSNKYNGITVLHKNGLSAPVQHRKPDAGGTATFILFVVTPADSGTYRCSYRPGGFYLLSSPLGKNPSTPSDKMENPNVTPTASQSLHHPRLPTPPLAQPPHITQCHHPLRHVGIPWSHCCPCVPRCPPLTARL